MEEKPNGYPESLDKYLLSKRDFDHLRKSWSSGNTSSTYFYPRALLYVLRSHNKILMDGREQELADIPLERLTRGISESEITREAYQTGLARENPPEETEVFFKQSMSNWNYFSGRYKQQDLNVANTIRIEELLKIDPTLQKAIIAHGFVNKLTRKSFWRHEEDDIFAILRRAAHESVNDPAEEQAIMTYLTCDALLSYIRRVKVNAILRLEDTYGRNGKLVERVFEDVDQLAKSLYPVSYINGWEDRLKVRRDQLRDELPEFAKMRLTKNVMESGFFWRNEDKMYVVFKEVLERIKSEGNADEALFYLARVTADEIINGDPVSLRPFELDQSLRIRGQVNELLEEGTSTQTTVKQEEIIRPPAVLDKFRTEVIDPRRERHYPPKVPEQYRREEIYPRNE